MSRILGHIPVRTCIGCRNREPQGSLVRLARSGSWVVLDRDRRVPGRGAWVHRRRVCLDRVLDSAKGKGILARAFRSPVSGIDVESIDGLCELVIESSPRESKGTSE